MLKLVPGPSIQLDNIKEGDDIYMDCVIKANPKITYINWYLEVTLFALFTYAI